MRKHLLVLLVVTVLVRGVMFVSFPLSGLDDNQAGQLYLIDRLVDGDLLIGNVRYNTGYPFFIAPVVAAANLAGPLNDRVVLAVQIALSASIPFFIYDIVRRTRSANEGLAVALLVAIDPFGLQWAHFYLPEGLAAFLITASLWLLLVYTSARSAALAGITLGIAILARLNAVIVAGTIGLLDLVSGPLSGTQRLSRTLCYGGGIALVLGAYIILIQFPSVSQSGLSCISGINQMESLGTKGIPMRAENGPASLRLWNLVSRPAYGHRPFFADTYPNWQMTEAWSGLGGRDAFMQRPPVYPYGGIEQATLWDIIYYLGPCEADSLFTRVFVESVLSEPVRFGLGVLGATVATLAQQDAHFGIRNLPSVDQAGTVVVSYPMGFNSTANGYYSGQTVWTPGIVLYEVFFTLLQPVKLLIFPALIWAAFSKSRLYVWSAIILVLMVSAGSIVDDAPEARIYAVVWMLWPILIGGMLWSLFNWSTSAVKWRKA